MNRRDFLKSIAAFGAAASIPGFLFSEIDDGEFLRTGYDYSHFNPKCLYGNGVMVYGTSDLREAMKVLDENLISVVPPNYRGMVEFMFRPPVIGGEFDMFDDVGSLFWKYSPNHNHFGYVASKAGIESING